MTPLVHAATLADKFEIEWPTSFVVQPGHRWVCYQCIHVITSMNVNVSVYSPVTPPLPRKFSVTPRVLGLPGYVCTQSQMKHTLDHDQEESMVDRLHKHILKITVSHWLISSVKSTFSVVRAFHSSAFFMHETTAWYTRLSRWIVTLTAIHHFFT